MKKTYSTLGDDVPTKEDVEGTITRFKQKFIKEAITSVL